MRVCIMSARIAKIYVYTGIIFSQRVFSPCSLLYAFRHANETSRGDARDRSKVDPVNPTNSERKALGAGFDRTRLKSYPQKIELRRCGDNSIRTYVHIRTPGYIRVVHAHVLMRTKYIHIKIYSTYM